MNSNGLDNAVFEFQEVLESMGMDIENQEGLQRTPERYITFLHEFLNPEPFEFTTFKADTNQMIVQKEITFYSICEHHLLPFFGTASIAYIPGEKMAGLSKLARTVQFYARRPQNQERITEQVAAHLVQYLSPKGVAVSLVARHLCMEMRGVQAAGAITRTTALRGWFAEDKELKAEFISQLKDTV